MSQDAGKTEGKKKDAKWTECRWRGERKSCAPRREPGLVQENVSFLPDPFPFSTHVDNNSVRFILPRVTFYIGYLSLSLFLQYKYRTTEHLPLIVVFHNLYHQLFSSGFLLHGENKCWKINGVLIEGDKKETVTPKMPKMLIKVDKIYSNKIHIQVKKNCL